MTAQWGPLPTAGLGESLAGLDPYLALADATGFADHDGDTPETLWPVSVQVDNPSYRPAEGAGLKLRSAHAGSPHFTALATRQAMAALAADPQVQRVQLAAARVPRRRWPLLQGAVAVASVKDPGLDLAHADGPRPGPVLLGVIDDGCPFAHPALQRADGQTMRVLRLWNQDPAARSARGAPAGFDHGAEFTRGDLQALRDAFSHAGVVDPAACYAAAGMPRLRHEASHGAHVLGLLAGARRRQGTMRIPTLPQLDERQGGSRTADLAFVQLPSAVLQGVSVAALEHHAYDGLRWLCNVAIEQGYEHLVVVLAYESWVGPHDGSSWFETAVDRLLDTGAKGAAPAALKGLSVQLMMPAGNSRQRAAHAEVGLNDCLRWQQPAGNEDPTFIELWAPHEAAGLQLRLTPPGGTPSPWVGLGEAANWATAEGSQACLLMTPASGPYGGRQQGVLRIGPTTPLGAGPKAPHGMWSLDLRCPQAPQLTVHARIGRVEAAVGVPRRNRQPHFVERTPAQANADRLHTLNGHACGRRPTVVGAMLDMTYPYVDEPALDSRGRPRRHLLAGVAAARSPLRGFSAAYSGSGPTEGPRQRPDASVPVEDGALWPGVLSLGPASASSFRLSGSSSAAPLRARAAADALTHATPAANVPRPQGDDPAMGPWVRRV